MPDRQNNQSIYLQRLKTVLSPQKDLPSTSRRSRTILILTTPQDASLYDFPGDLQVGHFPRVTTPDLYPATSNYRVDPAECLLNVHVI